MTDFAYSPMFPQAADNTVYELVSTEHVEMVDLGGEQFLKVDPEALRLLAQRAFTDISHLLRSSHLAQLRAILDDPEATQNDRFVALEMLKNAVVAATAADVPGHRHRDHFRQPRRPGPCDR